MLLLGSNGVVHVFKADVSMKVIYSLTHIQNSHIERIVIGKISIITETLRLRCTRLKYVLLAGIEAPMTCISARATDHCVTATTR